jgi:inner membrane protein
MLGWQNPRAGFVFHYYLYPPLDNTLVLQRGRFANWDLEATKAFVERIKGVD